MSLTIAISSGKGGVGKTTLAVNLAATLGSRALLIDGDLGLANVDVMLGIEPRHTLREVVDQGLPPSAVLVESTAGFSVLPASSGVPEMARLDQTAEQHLFAALDAVVTDFDVTLVDTAAGIGPSVLAFNGWAGFSCVVLTPDPTSLTDGYALVKVLHNRLQKSRFYFVINEVKSKQEGMAVFRHMQSVVTSFLGCEAELLGCIPRDPAATLAVRSRRPLVTLRPDCRAARAIAAIGRQLTALAGQP